MSHNKYFVKVAKILTHDIFESMSRWGRTALYKHRYMAKVVIYTTPPCVYCKMAKTYFNEHNVQYEEKNVMTDIPAQEEMIKKSGQLGVPVIDIDGKIVIGFDKTKIASLLNLK